MHIRNTLKSEVKAMKKSEKIERQKMVIAMEYIAHHINNENIFDYWLAMGVPDGEIEYGDFDYEKVDEFYIENDTYQELLNDFLYVMKNAYNSGGLVD